MLFRGFRKDNNVRALSPFLDEGFHGDQYLIKFVDFFISECEYFVETGANVGSTLVYVAHKYPNLSCFSCEPHKESYEEALKNTSSCSNVKIHNESSQEFMNILNNEKDLFDKKVLFWLDAHGYGFEWPLKEEIKFITDNFKSAYILIDDFKVPGLDCFKYDEYEDQICSFDFIKDSINDKVAFSLYYPSYTERTSEVHPLTGWGLFVIGNKFEIPAKLQGKIKKV